jgi:hypothetical protein
MVERYTVYGQAPELLALDVRRDAYNDGFMPYGYMEDRTSLKKIAWWTTKFNTKNLVIHLIYITLFVLHSILPTTNAFFRAPVFMLTHHSPASVN